MEFESNKAIIKQSSYSSLDGLAQLLKSHWWSVILKGYTDNSGRAAKNLQLSKDRAAAVKAYLVNKVSLHLMYSLSVTVLTLWLLTLLLQVVLRTVVLRLNFTLK